MTDLIYCSRQLVQKIDRSHDLMHPYFGAVAWKRIYENLRSRVIDMPCPVRFAPATSPMPRDLSGADTDFSRVFDSVADYYVSHTLSQGLKPYLWYSGGIDSTSVLVAFLRTGNRQFLDNLQIICNQASIEENPYLFDRFIRGRFQLHDTDTFRIDLNDWQTMAVFDGEAGNQALGSSIIYDFARAREYDRLASPWTELPPEFTRAHPYWQDVCRESIKHAPVDIETVHDLFWWIAFDFTWEEVLLRKILVYTHEMTAADRKQFYLKHLFRFYAHPQVQQWSLATTHQRRESLKTTTKYYPKRYIHEWDRNDIYFAQKREMGSVSQVFLDRKMPSDWIFGMDQDFNLLDIRDRSIRQSVGAQIYSPHTRCVPLNMG